MRVRIERTEYSHTEKGKMRFVRAHALVHEISGKPLYVGLFADEGKAEAYCKTRGWKLVKTETA